MSFTFATSEVEGELLLVCDACDEQVCTVEDRDDLGIVNKCAQDHADECAECQDDGP